MGRKSKSKGRDKVNGNSNIKPCFECEKDFQTNKLRKHIYPSEREGVDGYPRDVCQGCYDKLTKKDTKAKEEMVEIPFTMKLPAKVPPRTEPYPPSMKSDRKPKGHMHTLRSDLLPVPIGQSEESKAILLDVAKLPQHIQLQLGSAIAKIVRDETGGLPVRIGLEAVKFAYLVKHTKE